MLYIKTASQIQSASFRRVRTPIRPKARSDRSTNMADSCLSTTAHGIRIRRISPGVRAPRGPRCKFHRCKLPSNSGHRSTRVRQGRTRPERTSRNERPYKGGGRLQDKVQPEGGGAWRQRPTAALQYRFDHSGHREQSRAAQSGDERRGTSALLQDKVQLGRK